MADIPTSPTQAPAPSAQAAPANNLLDIIRNKMQSPSAVAPEAMPQVGQGAEAANLLRTKLTGKELPTALAGTPRQSAIGEQAAQDQFLAGKAQLQKQGAIGAEQLSQQSADQTSQAAIQAQQDQVQGQLKRQQFANQADNLVSDYANGLKQVNTQSDLSKLQNAATLARISNESYINNLTTEASKAGLDNQANFQVAYANAAIGNAGQILQGKIDFNALTNASTRDFEAAMSKISIDDAVKIAQVAAQETTSSAMYAGIGSAVSGVTGLAARLAPTASNTTPTVPAAGG